MEINMAYGIVVLALIINGIMIRKKINIGFVMAQNAIWIIIAKKLSLAQIVEYSGNGIFSEKTIGLLFSFVIILILESMMRKENMINQMVDGLKVIFNGSRVAPSIMPMFLGMLPSPGGARFSCPMVEEAAGVKSSPEDKAYINYWYRHIWMDGFILYPPIILAAEILDVSILTLFGALMPVMVAWFIVGTLMGLRHVQVKKTVRGSRKKAMLDFLKGVYPILLIITIYIVLMEMKVDFPLQISGILTVVILFVVRKISLDHLKDHLKEAVKLKYMIMLIGVMVFTEFFQSSGLINDVIHGVEGLGIPKELLIVVLPFIGGMISGISLTYVSLTFPVLAGLGIGTDMSLFILSYFSGSAGVMLTPIHLCSVMTAEYFKVSLPNLLKKVGLSSLLLVPFVVLIMMVKNI